MGVKSLWLLFWLSGAVNGTCHIVSFAEATLLVSCDVVNTLRPRQNRRHFADIFKIIFLNENAWIPIEISLKFVPKGSINNIPALVQIMAWRRPGDKPLSEPMLVRIQMHICVTRPQWVKSLQLIWWSGTYNWNQLVPYLQMNCSDFVWRWGTRIVLPVMTTRVTCALFFYVAMSGV